LVKKVVIKLYIGDIDRSK